MTSEAHPEYLEPSKLGTKEYWDNLYTTEISNHAADPSDIGTVWFDDSDAEAKVLEFLSRHFSPADLPRAGTSFLDLGCGNGSLLFSLRDYDEDDDEDHEERGEETGAQGGPWLGRLLGVDYSPRSVALARQIATSRAAASSDDGNISFEEWDALAGPLDTVLNGAQSQGWDVALDKGTFDAISLSSETDTQGRRLCEGYCERVLRVVRPRGYFIITSCNWTEPELRAWFEQSSSAGDGSDGHRFVLEGRVEYRTFSFGGVKGQTITTLCFRKLSTN